MLFYWLMFDRGRFGCKMVCGGVHGGLRCCTSDRLGCMRGLDHMAVEYGERTETFLLLPSLTI